MPYSIMKVYIILILSLVSWFSLVIIAGNLPEYEVNYKLLVNRSIYQTSSFINLTIPLPKIVNANPFIAEWPFANYNGMICIIWCPRKAWKPPCMYYPFSSDILFKSDENSFKSLIKTKMTMSYDHMRYQHMIEDARIFRGADNKSKIIYSIKIKGISVIHITRLIYNSSNLYPLFPSHKIVFNDNYKYTRNEKNWSPFIYDSKEYFVYSIIPHKIVAINESNSINNTYNAKVVYTSGSSDSWWRWGEPRGGTQTEKIETKFGTKYLTFFHSSGKYNHPAILTFFIGAYLFDVEPPFRITHVLTEPIYPKPLYDESFGWAYKAVDFIVYPMGYVIKKDFIYLSVGKNDNSGFIVKLHKSSFLDTMKSFV